MKAELKNVYSPDTDDLENYSPEKYDEFCILIQAVIGPYKGVGEENFDFIVCTPRWIEGEIKKESMLFGKGYLIIKDYNYKLILRAIQDLCSRVSGDDWKTIANKISRFGDWEFEDYHQ